MEFLMAITFQDKILLMNSIQQQKVQLTRKVL